MITVCKYSLSKSRFEEYYASCVEHYEKTIKRKKSQEARDKGYKDEMAEMISTNPGLASRIQFTLDFEDYTREELGEIAVRMLESKGYVIRDDALKLVLDLTDHFRKQDNFANARTVRNILDQVIMNQNLRTEDEGGNDIILSDVQDYITDEKIDLSKNQTKKIGF